MTFMTWGLTLVVAYTQYQNLGTNPMCLPHSFPILVTTEFLYTVAITHQ